MLTEAIESYFGWINERHSIYLRRRSGAPAPPLGQLTPYLQEFKFTNPFRENDRVTIWMRENWTKPNNNRPHGEILFNCCLFRMVGTSEFAEQHGWAEEFNPARTKELIQTRIDNGLRTFTGAYIITNQGLKAPKSEVVVDHFLRLSGKIKKRWRRLPPKRSRSKKYMKRWVLSGMGRGGFMSYEVGYRPQPHACIIIGRRPL